MRGRAIQRGGGGSVAKAAATEASLYCVLYMNLCSIWQRGRRGRGKHALALDRGGDVSREVPRAHQGGASPYLGLRFYTSRPHTTLV